MRGVLPILVATQAIACVDVHARVAVSQPEAQRVSQALSTHDAAVLHDENGEAFHADDKTPIDRAPDIFSSETTHTTFWELRQRCEKDPTSCALADDKSTFHAWVKTGTKADTGAIGAGVALLLASGVTLGPLVAGHVACFSGPCDDGVKAALVTTDIVLVVAGVLVGYAITDMVKHLRF